MQNTGQVLGPNEKGFPGVTSTGKAPALIEALRGRVALSSKLASTLKVYALDSKGRRLGEVETSVQDGKLSFTLSPKWGTLWFEICTASTAGPAAPSGTTWPLEEKSRINPVPVPALISITEYLELANQSSKKNNSSPAESGENTARLPVKEFSKDKSFQTFGNIQAALAADPERGDILRATFGKVNQEWAGGFWTLLAEPAGFQPKSCVGFGFSFKGDGTLPREAYLSLKGDNGVHYRSKNINKLFENDGWQEVVLKADDFEISPEMLKAKPDLAKSLPPRPEWTGIKRLDFVCIGPLMNQASTGQFNSFYYVMGKSSSSSEAKASTLPASLPSPKAPSSNKLSIPFLSNVSIKADGTADEDVWKKSLPVSMNEEAVPAWHFFGSHVVEGKRLEGEGANFWIFATETGLAITAEIQKGRPGIVAEKADWYKNDCLEIFTDPENKGGKPGKQLFLAYRQPNNDKATASDNSIQIGRSAIENGYVLEALIPWKALGFPERPSGEFGLEFQVDFSRTGLGRYLQMVYGTGTNEAFIKSDKFLKAQIQP
jgi:hypothetical protein